MVEIQERDSMIDDRHFLMLRFIQSKTANEAEYKFVTNMIARFYDKKPVQKAELDIIATYFRAHKGVEGECGIEQIDDGKNK